MTLPLAKAYPSRYGAPIIDRVDPLIFTRSYFAECMACTTCDDACCQYGADIELPRLEMVRSHAGDLEAFLGVPRDEWFRDDPDDVGVVEEPEYPGGWYTRTSVVELPAGRSRHTEEACVFLDPLGRGCRLHAYALARGMDVHDIKPMVCILFPLDFVDGALVPALELEIDDLVCQGPGASVYRAVRADLEYYFGREFVHELDRLDPRVATTISLPVCA